MRKQKNSYKEYIYLYYSTQKRLHESNAYAIWSSPYEKSFYAFPNYQKSDARYACKCSWIIKRPTT